jgi:hypothetical protein
MRERGQTSVLTCIHISAPSAKNRLSWMKTSVIHGPAGFRHDPNVEVE